MDPDPNPARSSLRQPFIETANALASLYKQAAAKEREARHAGAISAYRDIMQWAATKSTAGDPITPADVIARCAAHLTGPPPPPPPPPSPPSPTLHPPNPAHPTHPSQPSSIADHPLSTLHHPAQSNPHSHPRGPYIPKDDALLSDIRKLNVNPRKRQRVDISDAFIRACRNNDSLIFEASDPSCTLDIPEDSTIPFRPQPDSNDSPNSRTHPTRDNSLFSPTTADLTSSRKSKSVKAQLYDKLRKK